MSIYIPIIPILWGLLAYMIVGALLTPLFVWWADRFIHGNRRVWDGVSIPKTIVKCALFWLPVLPVFVHTEIDYRRKGYL